MIMHLLATITIRVYINAQTGTQECVKQIILTRKQLYVSERSPVS